MEILKSTYERAFKPLKNYTKQKDWQQQKEAQRGRTRMSNGQEVTKYYSRFLIIEKAYSINLIVQVFLSLLYYELQYVGDISKTFFILIALKGHLLVSLLLSILAHFSFNDYKKAQIKDQQTLGMSQVFFQWIIIIVQPFSFLNDYNIQNWSYMDNTYVPFKLNFLLTILSLLKFFIIIPCIMNLLKYKNPRSSRICKIYNCKNSNLFQIKCLFRSNPLTLTAVLVAFSIFFFSFVYRVSQRNQHIKLNLFSSYSNCVWIVILTMTTVGFGDFAPITQLGRTFGLLCTFCGSITVSLMVLVVITTFQMDINEDQSLRILKKLTTQKQIKKIAGQYIRLSLWRLWRNKKLAKNGLGQLSQQQSKEQKQKKHLLRQYIKSTRHQNNLNQKYLNVQMSRQFQRITFSLENIDKNFQQIIKYLGNQYFINTNEIKEEKKKINQQNQQILSFTNFL